MKRKVSAIIPSLVPETADLGLNRLLDPARFYDHPRDVLADIQLDHGEKRAILSSWASDACAVESLPSLRRPPCARKPVAFDEIMDALRALDRAGDKAVADGMPAGGAGARRLDA